MSQLVGEVYQVPAAEFKKKEQYLCTCGLSKNLPYCDGAHSKQGTPFKPIKVGISEDGNTVSVRSIKEVEVTKQASAKAAEEAAKPVVIHNPTPIIAFAAASVFILAIKKFCF